MNPRSRRNRVEGPGLMDVPMPGEVHPALRDHPSLRIWIEDHNTPTVEVLGIRSLRGITEEAAPMNLIKPIRFYFRRVLASGPAPYVGHPFVYVWEIGMDQYKRFIASEAHIHFLPEGFYG